VLQAQGFDVSIGGLAVLKDRQLLSLANIYRIDVKTLPVNRFDNLIDYLHRYDKLALQALKIETLEQYHAYCSKGFDYLQGYFFGKPHVYTSSDLSASKLAIVQLLAKVHDLDTPIEQLEQHIIQDVSLSYKLLKLINSPFFGMAKEVDSIKRAIVLLGREEIRKMVSLLALGGMSDEPAATLEIAFLRAKICELLAERVGLPQDSYFTVGMFSALDILMKQPLNDILSQLPLSDPVKQAILQRQGMLGEALSCALAIENAQWAEIDFAKLGYADLLDVYRLAIEWTDKVMKQL
jgi:EAL and modified HD-GYP domain-containing signal transduction protein